MEKNPQPSLCSKIVFLVYEVYPGGMIVTKDFSSIIVIFLESRYL